MAMAAPAATAARSTITATSATSTITTSESAGHGVLAQSLGGTGDDGHDGNTELITNSHGGNGGQGGTGGDRDGRARCRHHDDGRRGAGHPRAELWRCGRRRRLRLVDLANGDGGTAEGPAPAATSASSSPARSTPAIEANGILAQSVGGFAGDAGDASGLFSYGASSESGGDAGTVTVTVDSGSTITTTGDTSAAVDAQSIGGGGGKGIELLRPCSRHWAVAVTPAATATP